MILWTNFITMRELNKSDVEDKDCGVFDVIHDDQKDPDYVVFPKKSKIYKNEKTRE